MVEPPFCDVIIIRKHHRFFGVPGFTELLSRLVKAGMNVGRDVMAAMSNTLILAYAGRSLQMMLLLLAYDIPFIEIINRDMIASEVVRSLAGSIGLIFTIPITAIAAGILSEKKDKNQQRDTMDYRY
jgi:uncharacterized membrane protein